MDDLRLPVLKGIPEPNPKDIALTAYAEWVAGNFRSFVGANRYRDIRKQNSRQSVLQRFRLV